MPGDDQKNFSAEARYGDHGYPFGDRAYPYKEPGNSNEYKGKEAPAEAAPADAPAAPETRYDTDGKAGAAEHAGQDSNGYGYGYGLGGDKPVV